MKKIAFVLCCLVSCTVFATKGRKKSQFLDMDIPRQHMRNLKERRQNEPRGYESSAYSEYYGDDRTTTTTQNEVDISELTTQRFTQEQE